MIHGVFHESRSVKEARVTESGVKRTIWKGHFDFEGELDGMAQGELLAAAPLGEGRSHMEGFGVYTPSSRSMFDPGQKLIYQLTLDFPGEDGAEFKGTMVIYGDGVRVELKLISGETQTYEGTVFND